MRGEGERERHGDTDTRQTSGQRGNVRLQWATVCQQQCSCPFCPCTMTSTICPETNWRLSPLPCLVFILTGQGYGPDVGRHRWSHRLLSNHGACDVCLPHLLAVGKRHFFFFFAAFYQDSAKIFEVTKWHFS